MTGDSTKRSYSYINFNDRIQALQPAVQPMIQTNRITLIGNSCHRRGFSRGRIIRNLRISWDLYRMRKI